LVTSPAKSPNLHAAVRRSFQCGGTLIREYRALNSPGYLVCRALICGFVRPVNSKQPIRYRLAGPAGGRSPPSDVFDKHRICGRFKANGLEIRPSSRVPAKNTVRNPATIDYRCADEAQEASDVASPPARRDQLGLLNLLSI
jgi:hypothetical protein